MLNKKKKNKVDFFFIKEMFEMYKQQAVTFAEWQNAKRQFINEHVI